MEFVDWYEMYPRKVARQDAMKAWRGMSPREREQAAEKLPAHVAYWNAAGTEKEFIPYPASWLRGKRWEDEIAMPALEKKISAWWTSDEGTLAKGRELGIAPRPGEEMRQFRERVMAKMREAA